MAAGGGSRTKKGLKRGWDRPARGAPRERKKAPSPSPEGREPLDLRSAEHDRDRPLTEVTAPGHQFIPAAAGTIPIHG